MSTFLQFVNINQHDHTAGNGNRPKGDEPLQYCTPQLHHVNEWMDGHFPSISHEILYLFIFDK